MTPLHPRCTPQIKSWALYSCRRGPPRPVRPCYLPATTIAVAAHRTYPAACDTLHHLYLDAQSVLSGHRRHSCLSCAIPATREPSRHLVHLRAIPSIRQRLPCLPLHLEPSYKSFSPSQARWTTASCPSIRLPGYLKPPSCCSTSRQIKATRRRRVALSHSIYIRRLSREMATPIQRHRQRLQPSLQPRHTSRHSLPFSGRQLPPSHFLKIHPLLTCHIRRRLCQP